MYWIIQALNDCMATTFEIFGYTISFRMVFIGTFVLDVIGMLICGTLEGGDSNAG